MSDNNLQNNPLVPSSVPMPLPASVYPDTSATQMTTLKPPLIPVGDLISQVFSFYKKHWKLFLQISVWPTGLGAGLFILTGLSDLMVGQGGTGLFVSIVNWTASLFYLLVVIAGVWSGAALIFACKEPTTWQAAYRLSWHKLGAYLWLAILTGLVVMGGTMLFVIPGIIFTLWFIFPAWILVFEGLKGRDALLKSKFYVQGYWWAIFGRQLLFSLLVAAVVGGAMLFGLLLSSLVKMISPAASPILTIVWQCLLSLFISPLNVVLVYVLYQDVKNKKSAIVFEITPRAKKHLTWWALWGGLGGPIIILAIIIVLMVFLLWLPDAQSLLISNFYG